MRMIGILLFFGIASRWQRKLPKGLKAHEMYGYQQTYPKITKRSGASDEECSDVVESTVFIVKLKP